jgi:hypothetical protein
VSNGGKERRLLSQERSRKEGKRKTIRMVFFAHLDSSTSTKKLNNNQPRRLDALEAAAGDLLSEARLGQAATKERLDALERALLTGKMPARISEEKAAGPSSRPPSSSLSGVGVAAAARAEVEAPLAPASSSADPVEAAAEAVARLSTGERVSYRRCHRIHIPPRGLRLHKQCQCASLRRDRMRGLQRHGR